MPDPDLAPRLGALAAIALSEAELGALSAELPAILAYIDQLREVDGPEAARGEALGPASVTLREDVPRPSLSSAEALANAPTRLADRFLVPAWRDSA